MALHADMSLKAGAKGQPHARIADRGRCGLGVAVRDHIAGRRSRPVDWVKRLDEARDALADVALELILLDLNLPDGRGLDFLRSCAGAAAPSPVIILTAMDQIAWRIDGLNAGADDYLVKPFDLSELSARLAAVARRYGGNPNPLLQPAASRSTWRIGSSRRRAALSRFDGARMGAARAAAPASGRDRLQSRDRGFAL